MGTDRNNIYFFARIFLQLQLRTFIIQFLSNTNIHLLLLLLFSKQNRDRRENNTFMIALKY